MVETAPSPASAVPSRLLMPAVPAVVAGLTHAVILDDTGEILPLSLSEASAWLEQQDSTVLPLLCHAPATFGRLRCDPRPALDLLELFAFVHPARFCIPTIRGLAHTLHLPPPQSLEDQAEALYNLARLLLSQLIESNATAPAEQKADLTALAWTLHNGGWSWSLAVLAALGLDATQPQRPNLMRLCERLSITPDNPADPAVGDHGVKGTDAVDRLTRMLPPEAEYRPGQTAYTHAVTAAFQPRQRVDDPNLVLAEAGTGTGKTLGYIAPASLWAEKNQAPVWISTYTRNLQRQLDHELSRLYPLAEDKKRRVVVRKGRENYLCLLNYQDMASRSLASESLTLGLIGRWLLSSRDGDMVGGDLPGWLPQLLGRGRAMGLSDQRGECIHGACEYYSRCFVESSIRRARHADLVVANHALVMVQAALNAQGVGDEEAPEHPTRYVFDEGHHLFDAADAAFSSHLSGREGVELRRWLLGPETGTGRSGGRSRARGLKRRAEDLLTPIPDGMVILEEACHAASLLPQSSWLDHIRDDNPQGPFEGFLAAVFQQVLARSDDPHSWYSLECAVHPPGPDMAEQAADLGRGLQAVATPLRRLMTLLTKRLNDEAGTLDTATRQRLVSLAQSIQRRALLPLQSWIAMLEDCLTPPVLDPESPPLMFDWLAVERVEGRNFDIGLYRHWIDPTRPFAELVLKPSHGVVITSATLRDGPDTAETPDWTLAHQRTGTPWLLSPPHYTSQPSPFNYGERTRVLIVTDVNNNNPDQLAAAYRELFLASGGGALGLFTAVNRLKATHSRIVTPLDTAGIPLLAQHIDVMDTATLVDIFRAEDDSCLLGTDAMRDGVDVPGRSLRLLVFDRVPWPRADLLHRSRRTCFGGREWDEALTRLRLKQAFGRLVRNHQDRGVFVMLDARTPSRLLTAFPAGVTPQRVGLAEAVTLTREALA